MLLSLLIQNWRIPTSQNRKIRYPVTTSVLSMIATQTRNVLMTVMPRTRIGIHLVEVMIFYIISICNSLHQWPCIMVFRSIKLIDMLNNDFIF